MTPPLEILILTTTTPNVNEKFRGSSSTHTKTSRSLPTDNQLEQEITLKRPEQFGTASCSCKFDQHVLDRQPTPFSIFSISKHAVYSPFYALRRKLEGPEMLWILLTSHWKKANSVVFEKTCTETNHTHPSATTEINYFPKTIPLDPKQHQMPIKYTY